MCEKFKKAEMTLYKREQINRNLAEDGKLAIE